MRYLKMLSNALVAGGDRDGVQHSRIWLGLVTTAALVGSIGAPLALRGRGTLAVPIPFIPTDAT